MDYTDIAGMRARLLELIKSKAVIFGERTLASGKKSSYYIDGKMITFDPEGLYLTGQIMLSMIDGKGIDAVGGLTLGADPIVSAISVLGYARDIPVKAFVVRAAKKDHGTGKAIEGPIRQGWSVVIVDDVVTTGGSAFKAIDEAIKAGCRVKKVIAIVDRMEGAREAFAERDITFQSIFRKDDLGL